MDFLWTFILVTCCVSGALSGVPKLDPHDQHPSGAIWSLLKQTYGDVPRLDKPTNASGSPLFLTPYIEANKLKEAREAARVNLTYLLPGVDSYAGYFTVNKTYNSNLWFWYFPVSGKKVEDTPWIIWLQGGPGASSLFGLFSEIGPFYVTDENILEKRKYSWGKNHSLLFIDNPVGAGFSFTEDKKGYATDLTTVGKSMYIALQQFLTIFSELRKAPLTIAGESYAGKYIPALGIQICWNRGEQINLQGLAIGNGWIDPLTMQRYSYFVREIGLVGDREADQMLDFEEDIVDFIKNGNYLNAYSYFNMMLGFLVQKSNMTNLYNYVEKETDLTGPWVDFIQTDKFRKALHVGQTKYDMLSSMAHGSLLYDFMQSSKHWLQELIANYKVMVYSGQFDIIVAYHPSVNTYNSLSFPGSSQFKKSARLSWFHDDELAGYHRTAGNLTEVMVRGAGHMVPIDKPAAALGLISAFIRGISLDRDTAALVPTK